MATIEQRDNRIHISGKLDLTAAGELFGSQPTISGDTTIVDLSAVEELESAGLALLVHWRQQAEAEGGQLLLEGTPGQAENLIRISGLESMLAGQSG